ncbi:hypothetical protein HMPREF1640_04310 [Prevotella sp. S7-1-8]|nr:hypothetical protein HMPREF1640_04310 [Prevotella sp. S7-1-8]
MAIITYPDRHQRLIETPTGRCQTTIKVQSPSDWILKAAISWDLDKRERMRAHANRWSIACYKNTLVLGVFTTISF